VSPEQFWNIYGAEWTSAGFLFSNSNCSQTGWTGPEVPQGKWFKRFPEMTVCGEGELIKTFLPLGQVPEGREVS
jgi:hypothetical protein